jgi:hypothetical protein
MWLAAVVLGAASLGAAGDWKGDLAKTAVGHAVREGLQDAVQDAALDAAFDAVAPEAVDFAADRLRDRAGDVAFAATTVGDGIETAMRVADVADKLDNVRDAARWQRSSGSSAS